jgi:hypothetical protein
MNKFQHLKSWNSRIHLRVKIVCLNVYRGSRKFNISCGVKKKPNAFLSVRGIVRNWDKNKMRT